MQQRKLGPDGPSVGVIGLGTAPLCTQESRPSMEDAVRLAVHSAELGATLWDTADAYCRDESEMGYGERLCRKALEALPAELREQVVVATKGGTVRPGGSWKQNGRPEYLRQAIDASLKALGTDCIDLWQHHAPDASVPFADSVGASAQAKEQGKIRLIGLSNVSVAQIEEAMNITPIASVQNRYGFKDREPEKDGTLEKCRELGIAFLPYSPLGGSGSAKSLGENDALAEVAGDVGVSPQQVVLAWLLRKYELMIPIPGATRIASMEDSVHAADLSLSDEQMQRLDAASA